MRHGFSARLSDCVASRGASQAIPCSECYTTCSKSALALLAGNVAQWHTYFSLIDSCGAHFYKRIFGILHIGWIDCRDAFHAVLHF